ncbi:unnamed protein product [Rhodiola kirilowii]
MYVFMGSLVTHTANTVHILKLQVDKPYAAFFRDETLNTVLLSECCSTPKANIPVKMNIDVTFQ